MSPIIKILIYLPRTDTDYLQFYYTSVYILFLCILQKKKFQDNNQNNLYSHKSSKETILKTILN